MSNIEQGTPNAEVSLRSAFDIPCSIFDISAPAGFDIRYSTSLFLSHSQILILSVAVIFLPSDGHIPGPG